MKSILALTAAAALFGASTVSASAAIHGHQDVTRQAMHRRGAERIQRITRRAETAALLAVQNSTSTSADALSTTAIWWAEDGWVGSCGVKIDNTANTVGLPTALYPKADEASGLCGQTAWAVNPATGQSVSVVVVDGSDRSNYATFSKSAYLALGGNLDTGMLPITLTLSQAAAEAVAADASSASSSIPVTVASSITSATSVVTSSDSQSSTSTAATVSSVAATTSKATTTDAPTTTAAPTTTTVDQAALAAASSSKAWEKEQQQSLQLAAQASASSQAAAAYAASQAAASEAAASQAAASQAAASQAAASQAAASQAAASQAAASEAAAQAAASQQAAAAASASEAAAQAAASQAAAAAEAAKKQKPSGGNVYSGGYATYYTQNGVAGNCGAVNPDSAFIVALPTATYAGGSNCGKQVSITRVSTGQTIQATVADSCPTCVNNACLDLSVAAFTAIATEAEGMVDITWQFI